MVNYVMCDLENKALMIAFDCLLEQNIEVGSLVFDGLMIYKDNVSPTRLEDILVGLSKRIKDVMSCDITFTNKIIHEKYDNIPVLNSPMKKGNFDLLLLKGVFPYDYIDSLKRLDATKLPRKLPRKESFYSKLFGSDISDEDY